MQISPHCYAVTGLAYSPPWFVNAGFVVGEDVTLVVDTGGNAAAAATIHGYATAVRRSNELRVLNTEKHFDHIGGNGFFQARGAQLWGHPEIARTSHEFEVEIGELNDTIPNRVRRERQEAQVFFQDTRAVNPGYHIRSDTTWDLGGLAVQILPTPGHTRTNLSVWVESERVLYTGDCLIHSYLPNLEAGGPTDWTEWLRSIDRLEALGAHTIVCGHGPVAVNEDVPRMIGEVRRALREALARGCAPTSG
jgi:glyoxylase-like metal-dependent hydrolase (beta-lactamase superfamily II)